MADPNKLKVVREHGRRDILFGLARSPNSSELYFGSSDAKAYHLDAVAEKPEPQELAAHTSYVTGCALAGDRLVTGGYDRRLIWWDAAKGEAVKTIDAAHAKWIRNVVASPDGQIVASVADDMVCRLWDAKSGKPIRELKGHAEKTPTDFPSMLFNCAFSRDGKLLATVDKVGHIVVWAPASGKKLAEMDAPGMYTWDPRQRLHSIGGIRSVAFSPDGKLLAVGGIGQIGNVDHLGAPARVEVFEWETQKQTHEFAKSPFKGLVEHLEFHHEGKWLVAAGGAGDGFVVFFDLAANKVIAEHKAPMHVHRFALDEKSQRIYAVGFGKVVTWELEG